MTGLSRSQFYKKSVREEKQLQADLALKNVIDEIHEELPGYGYRRVREHLLREGKTVNSKRLRRVMKKYSLFSCVKKMMKPRGTHTELRLVYPNLVRGLKLNAPNQLWATDITFIKLVKGYVYLSAVIDVYTRKVVGWAVSTDLSHKFCLKSLDIAVRRYQPSAGIIHHSDRGVQYCCQDYVRYLLDHGFDI
ncbi:MAG: IS3 family transposase, partial [Proteobacteria bacterium]